jgi:hypothetical protein
MLGIHASHLIDCADPELDVLHAVRHKHAGALRHELVEHHAIHLQGTQKRTPYQMCSHVVAAQLPVVVQQRRGDRTMHLQGIA